MNQTMAKQKWSRFWVLMILPILSFRALSDSGLSYKTWDFWWIWFVGQLLTILVLVGLAATMIGLVKIYWRFCVWFDRALTRRELRSRAGIVLRNGQTTWPASDPLHDRELDV